MRTLILLLSLLLTACSTDQKTLLPVDENTTMLNIWGRQNNDAQALYDARSVLRRPLDDATMTAQQQQTTRSDDNATQALFRRLPNPDLELYIFPHLAGSEGVRCRDTPPSSPSITGCNTPCPASGPIRCDDAQRHPDRTNGGQPVPERYVVRRFSAVG